MTKRSRPYLVSVLLLSLVIVNKVATAQRPEADIRPVPDLAAAASSASPVPIPPGILNKASATGFETVVKPFLSENCVRCHGNKKHEKDLNFQAFTSAETFIEHRERWDEVVRKLKGSEMPPLEEDQPDEDQRQAVATWVEKELNRIDRVTPPDPGRVTARRLNRTEYNNTIRDLLGVDSKPADDFPQDDAGYGFDNIADVLSLSPVLMEKYVTAADRVARLALFGPPHLDPTLTKLRSDGRRPGDAHTFPESYDVTGVSLPNAFHAMYRVPVEGEYAIRVVLGGARPAGSAPITVSLWIDDREVQSRVYDLEGAARFDLDRQDFGGQATEFRVKLAPGDRHIAVAIPRIFEGLPARLHGPNPSARPEPVRTFTPPPNATPERIAQAKQRFEDAQVELQKIPYNGVRVGSVDVGGPYTQTSGPSRTSLEKIYTCGHLHGGHQPICARQIMTSLARRAFRRPVTALEIQKYLDLVQLAQKQENSFEEGLAVGIQALLVSPDFLFRIERDRRPATRTPTTTPASISAAAKAGALVQPINQHELASRLSYFIWASIPDAQLRRAADAGTLRDPRVLELEVRRMLRDPKAHALAEHFGGQWLQFRALESVTRDKDRFPDFEDYLRYSMRQETELFVENIIREDRSILDFIDGQYTFLNERLARHYGIANVSGPEFRRVDLAGTPRGGVLTQASVLTVSSYATRTSPVLRGKWILENLLDSPPPPPPPDVPNLDESSIGTAASMRAQLEAHRKDPICASCHRRMDPLGFGLENFDAVGVWRTIDGKFPIDASGALPDGRTFTGPVELRAILEGDREAFAKCLATKLLTYALGRGLERYDTKTVKLIAGRLPARGYRFSALVLEVVNSLPFQSRRPAAMDPTTRKGTPAP
jgi:mono/diheme cytochrome c family protein